MYIDNEKIEDFQYVLESNLNALEGIDHEKMSQLKKIKNEIEYARFLFSKSEQFEKVEESIINLKEVLEWYI